MNPISVGEGIKPFLLRVWKPLSMCFKTLRGNPKEKAQRGQYLLAMGLGCYKWYQGQSPGGVLATLGLQEGWIVRSYIGWRGERNILYKGVETSP